VTAKNPSSAPPDPEPNEKPEELLPSYRAESAPTSTPDQELDPEIPVGTIVGEYRTECMLGSGGMGVVYGAVHPVIGKRAAVKVLNRQLSANREAIERFKVEARAVNEIGHPNVVDVFGFGTLSDGRHYMLMEWLNGETLSTRMRGSPVTIRQACAIISAIAGALKAAHTSGIVHRDLKPDNVFLARSRSGEERVKLLDFGIAKLLGGSHVGIEKTRTGMLIGTPAYMSPEQARGIAVGAASDVYSLGIVAYEMLCQRPPFTGETAMDIVVAHIQQVPPVPRDLNPALPEALEALLLAMLEKQPARRPSLDEVLAAVEGVATASPAARLGTLPAAAPRASVASHPPGPNTSAKTRRQAMIGGIVVIALFGVVGLTGWSMRGRSNAKSVPIAQPSPTGSAPAKLPPAVRPAVAAGATVDAPPDSGTVAAPDAGADREADRDHKPAVTDETDSPAIQPPVPHRVAPTKSTRVPVIPPRRNDAPSPTKPHAGEESDDDTINPLAR